MFTSRKQLIRKSGKKGVDRFEYLQELVNEFYQTNSIESREQVLANLANFAYDPLNYHYLRELKVIEIFIENLGSPNTSTVEYSVKGLCNLACDPTNQEVIFKYNGLAPIKRLLDDERPDIILPSLTLLFFLVTPSSLPGKVPRWTLVFFLK